MREPEPLRITIDGATPEELARGLAAARHVFEGAGATAAECATAAWRLELLDIAGVYELGWRIDQLKKAGAPADEIAAVERELAEVQQEPSYQDLTDREVEIMDYWTGAERAAVRACCAGWPNPPSTARLSTMTEEDEAELERVRQQIAALAGEAA